MSDYLKAKGFLQDRAFMHDRVLLGIDIHPAESELIQFEAIAKQISPNQDFSWRGCQECVNHLIKFVFENVQRLNEEPSEEGTQMSFPSHKTED